MALLSLRKKSQTSPVRAEIGRTVAARLAALPGAIRARTDAAEIFTIPDWMPADECARLISIIDSNRRPSTTLTQSSIPDFRTSESCDLDRWSPEIQPIDERIAALVGLPPDHAETMQGQRYAPGQQFRAHFDYFTRGEGYWDDMMKSGGQRTWTAMIYLNDVEEGGATWFPQAGFRANPRRGMMLVWNNMKPDGSPNPATLHEGMAVVRGTKYIITKWFRERSWLK